MDKNWKLTGIVPNGLQAEIVINPSGYIVSFHPEKGWHEPAPHSLDGFSALVAEEKGFMVTSGRRPNVTFEEATVDGASIDGLHPYFVFRGYDRIMELKITSFAPMP